MEGKLRKFDIQKKGQRPSPTAPSYTIRMDFALVDSSQIDLFVYRAARRGMTAGSFGRFLAGQALVVVVDLNLCLRSRNSVCTGKHVRDVFGCRNEPGKHVLSNE